MDEYLYMDKFNSIQELIKSYGDFSQLYINYRIFSSNNKIDCDESSLINNYNYSTRFNTNWGKSLCKVKDIDTSNGPHRFKLINNKITINLKNNKVNFSNYEPPITKNIDSTIYIAHYFLGSLKLYLKRRLYNVCSGNTINNIIRHFGKDYANEALKLKNNNTLDELILKIINKEINVNDTILKVYYLKNKYYHQVENNNIIDFYNKKL